MDVEAQRNARQNMFNRPVEVSAGPPRRISRANTLNEDAPRVDERNLMSSSMRNVHESEEDR